MIIEMFNFWYFFWLFLCISVFIGLYFLLRNRSDKTKWWTLLGILIFALILHFLKSTFPPYSTDIARHYRDAWFVNICAANIALFPFFFISKNETLKDYMLCIGLISSLLALFYPQEPIDKIDQLAEQIDIIRFYIHHFILGAVPLLMVMLGLHKPSYKRIFKIVPVFAVVLLFIMMNQILASELGFIPLRNDSDFININYKNSSYIWGPHGGIGDFLAMFCPDFFKTVPVGEYANQEKFWPWFWILIPAFVLITPLSFGLYMIFDRKNFLSDVKVFFAKVKTWINSTKNNKESLKILPEMSSTKKSK
jgi:hypothetical protein